MESKGEMEQGPKVTRETEDKRIPKPSERTVNGETKEEEVDGLNGGAAEERARQVKAIMENEDLGQRGRARELLRLGYTPQQCPQFGVPASTAYGVRAEMLEPEGKAKGADGEHREQALAPTMKDKETVVPEWLAGQVRTLYDGDERTAQVFMAGMSIPLLGIRLFSEAMKPLGDMMKLWQAGQVEAARAAQGTGEQIAGKAAQEAAAGVANYFERTKPWLSSAPNPLQAMLVDVMRPMVENVAKAMMPQVEGQESAPAGFTRRKEEPSA